MVKQGGTKRKIPIEKITKKLSIPPTFTKRRDGLFSKASQLCLLSGAQIAILVTPLSSESNVSFYSFGHSSVDAVVSAYLSGQVPLPVIQGNNKQTREDVGVCLTREDLGLGNWWEDESLYRSENPEELRHAMDSMWTLLSHLKALKTNAVNNDRREEMRTHQAFVNDDYEDLKKKKDVVVLDKGTQESDQTLILQSTTFPEICCIPDDDIIVIDDDDSPANFDKITEEQYQINEICQSFDVSDYNQVNMDYNQEMEIEHDHSPVNFNEITEEDDLNNKNALAEWADIDQLIDFNTLFETQLDDWFSKHTVEFQETCARIDDVFMETTTSSIPCSDSKGLEDNGLVLKRCLDEDDLRFSDYFNDITTTIAAV